VRLTDAAVRSFARHETFHPRYGWFRKAYTVAARDPGLFGRPDAPVEIGVGKNMVRAIRFWGLAAKLIAADPHSPNRRAPRFVPTRRGHALFGNHGWDPYMEDPGTLWLLHWLLLAPPSRLPVWWLAFNEFGAVEFAESGLTKAVGVQLEAAPEWSAPHESSVRKDVGALLRTYAPAEHSRRVAVDDLLDCPMRELGLLGRSPATGLCRFTLGSKPTLPSAVVAHTVLDYMTRTGSYLTRTGNDSRTGSGGHTVTLTRLALAPGAPGRAFMLNEQELLDALRPAVESTDGLSLAAPAGAWQLAWNDDPAWLATTVLDAYYGSAATTVCSGCEGDAVDDYPATGFDAPADPTRAAAVASAEVAA